MAFPESQKASKNDTYMQLIIKALRSEQTLMGRNDGHNLM